MTFLTGRIRPIIWQVLFIFLGTSWLLAPGLNHYLSDRTTLISQYEASGQPYALLFRLGDLLAATLLVWVAYKYSWRKAKTIPALLLLVIGIGMVLDPIFAISCQHGGTVCHESFSIVFLVHAIESVTTGLALFTLAAYDAKNRQKLVSILFVIFQVAYGVLFLSQYAEQQQFNTASQYAYQCATIIWLAWFVRDYLLDAITTKQTHRLTVLVRYGAFVWVLLNGLAAIVLSLSDINLLGKTQNLYFSADTAWLAQHGVIVGVIMLYLSRHILRGEQRARQIILAVLGIEALKYAVLTPNWVFALLYSLGFCFLFATANEFQRGSIPLTWKLRVKDLGYLLVVLVIASLLAWIVLDRDSRVSRIASRSFDHLSYYALHTDRIHRTHKESVLLAHTTTAFLIASTGAVLWILFKPYKTLERNQEDQPLVRSLLEQYSNSSEDYFKIWPADKQYFWNVAHDGFVAYKIVGSIAFALADPMCSPEKRKILVDEFVEWANARRLSACFLPITESNLSLYAKLTPIQIGASAVVRISDFVTETNEEKWWRWKKNRANKQGYTYAVSQPPHSLDFLEEVKNISDAWLVANAYRERGFALGHFDQDYLRQCTIHYLVNASGAMVAFANQLPLMRPQSIATVDLMRYRADATDTMPFLLSNVIKTLGDAGYTYFDLGFVPFAETKGPLQAIAQAFSGRRFSAKGLQQFKNKFRPEWRKIYLAYNGDLADLAAIALHIEAAMDEYPQRTVSKNT